MYARSWCAGLALVLCVGTASGGWSKEQESTNWQLVSIEKRAKTYRMEVPGGYLIRVEKDGSIATTFLQSEHDWKLPEVSIPNQNVDFIKIRELTDIPCNDKSPDCYGQKLLLVVTYVRAADIVLLKKAVGDVPALVGTRYNGLIKTFDDVALIEAAISDDPPPATAKK